MKEWKGKCHEIVVDFDAEMTKKSAVIFMAVELGGRMTFDTLSHSRSGPFCEVMSPR